MVTGSLLNTASWVVVDSDFNAIVETYNPAITTAKLKPQYRVLTILEYLGELNRRLSLTK